jgi:hypothetical protein
MRLALTAFGLFLAAFCVHVLWWRIRLPKRQLWTLLRGLTAFFPLGMGMLCGLGLWPAAWFTSPAIAVVALLYFSLTITYVITYSALEGDSPSLSLVRWIATRPEGVTAAELDAFMAQRPFIRARLRALQEDALTEERDGRLFIRGTPSLFFRAILAWRTLYGPMDRGG